MQFYNLALSITIHISFLFEHLTVVWVVYDLRVNVGSYITVITLLKYLFIFFVNKKSLCELYERHIKPS